MSAAAAPAGGDPHGARERRGAGRLPRLLFLVGPTAVGKTAVAIELAERLETEILSIDSRQAYRRLTIGTAKPSAAEQARVRHHLLDLFAPDEVASAAVFAAHYERARATLAVRAATVLAVGGSGLYVDACLGRLDRLPPADPAVRAEHAARRAREGCLGLHRELAAIDPPTAARLAPGDFKRISRALEVFALTGTPLSRLQTRRTPPDLGRDPRLLLLTRERAELDARIAARGRAMLAAGLLDELRSLLAEGVSASAPGLQAIGYGDFLGVLAGREPLDAALARFLQRTRRYARRQLTWFRNRYRGVTEVRLSAGLSAEQGAERCLQALRDSEPGAAAT